MRISPEGILEIQTFEALELKPYRDNAGFLTIGYGHKITFLEKLKGTILINGVKTPWLHGITLEEAINLFKQDLIPTQVSINQMVKVPLTQPQFDALTSFTFNVGGGALEKSSLLMHLNLRKYSLIPSHMKLFINSNGQRNQGLVNRRDKEIAMWNGEYPKTT